MINNFIEQQTNTRRYVLTEMLAAKCKKAGTTSIK